MDVVGEETQRHSTDAILFDRDQVERLEDLADRPRRLAASKLLWVDVHRGSEIGAREVAEAFGLDDRRAIISRSPNERPVFDDHGRYIHITTYAPREDEEGELHAVECVVGKNWVVTAHDRPIPVLEEFAERVSGSGDTGSLDGPGFLAALLEWVLGSYTAAFERIEQRLEDFDVHAMRGEGADEDIERLVEMRRAGRQAAPRARRPPLRARRADAPGAGGARRTTPPASGSSRSSRASRRRCRRRETRARRSSAHSTS